MAEAAAVRVDCTPRVMQTRTGIDSMSKPAAPDAVKPTTGRFAWSSSRIMLGVVLAATFVMRARMLEGPARA